MTDDTEYQIELLKSIESSLAHIETLLDSLVTIAEDTEDAASELAWRSHSWFWRWRIGRKHHKMFTRMKEVHLHEDEDKPSIHDLWPPP